MGFPARGMDLSQIDMLGKGELSELDRLAPAGTNGV